MIEGYRARWDIQDPIPDHIIQDLGNLSVMLSHLLYVRGWSSSESILEFMTQPEPEYDPFLLPNMRESVERIRYALDHEEKIAIYGDFDCDGLTASAILYETFNHLGVQPTVIVPNRQEGHGLAEFRLRQLEDIGTNLIITVDTGTSASKEVEYCHSLGMDIIVTDHHTYDNNRPDCLVINPYGSSYPYPHISGAGVAYKLATALLGQPPRFTDDLVGLGTIADVVPLLDENRTFAIRGLQKMRTGDRKGLVALLKSSGVDIKRLQTSSVAFYIAPKINSANRLSSPQIAFDLLVTNDETIAKEKSKSLSSSNKQRQELLEECFVDIIGTIDKEQFLIDVELGERPPILLVYGDWPNGLSGLLASRLSEMYGVPVVCAAPNDWGEVAASARSVPGVDILALLERSAHFFKKHGGHKGAAGFICRTMEDWEKARASIEADAIQYIDTTQVLPVIKVDAEINLSQVTFYALEGIYKLGPYGHQFPEPTFTTFGVRLMDKKPTNDGKHLMMTALSQKTAIRAVMFFHDPELEMVDDETPLDIVYNIECNTWKGKSELQLLIRDWRYGDEL